MANATVALRVGDKLAQNAPHAHAPNTANPTKVASITVMRNAAGEHNAVSHAWRIMVPKTCEFLHNLHR